MASPSNSHKAVNDAEGVINDKDEKSKKPSRPWNDWRWLASLSAFFMTVALVASILIFGGSLARLARDNGDIAACRAKYALNITTAQVVAEIYEYRLFGALATGETQEQLNARAEEIDMLTINLEKAVKARIDFESNITLPCPLEAVPYSSYEPDEG